LFYPSLAISYFSISLSLEIPKMRGDTSCLRENRSTKSFENVILRCLFLAVYVTLSLLLIHKFVVSTRILK